MNAVLIVVTAWFGYAEVAGNVNTFRNTENDSGYNSNVNPHEYLSLEN